MLQQRLMSPVEVAALLDIKVETLCSWRYTKKQVIPYVKVGSRVRYEYDEVVRFIKSRKIDS